MTNNQFIDKWVKRFKRNDKFLISPEDFQEFAQDVAFFFGLLKPVGGVYLRLRNGKTLWHLGTEVRDKTKLWLRKFSGGTLPAILPAPVLDPNRPAGVAAPGAPFPLSGFISGPATGPAAIAEYTRMVEDGNHVVLTGSDIDKAAYPVYQGGNFYATTVTEQDFEKAAVRLPRVGAAWDAALAWPSTGAGIGLPVLLNVARVKWEQDVWAPGLEINIFGENLAHGNVEGGAGYVAIQQNGGPVKVYSTTAANPYRAPFKVPGTVVPGDLDYWYHNGHGGEYGWSAKRTVKVVGKTEHVLTQPFGAPVLSLTLSSDPNDAGANVTQIRDAYQAVAQQGGGTFSTTAGPAPINDTIQPKDNVRWVCATADSGGLTSLVATNWIGGGNLGMFGSNYWVNGVLDGIECLKPAGVTLANAEAVIVLNNVDQIQLRRVRSRWNAPYAQRQAGPVMEAVPAQPLRLATSKNVFLDELGNTGSGMHLGSNSQVFLTNYTHRATHNADYMLYSLNMLGWSMIGYDLRDLDPTSTDGVDRGIRCIKSGGQGGRNRYRHLEKGVGTQLGIVRSGTNQAPDDNQFEQDLDELNKTVYTDQVVSATATTVTVPRTLLVQVNNQPVSLVKPDEHLVAIVAGRGVGQWRGVVGTTTNTITVDEPWLVQPDATSVLHTGWFNTDSTRYDVHYTGKPDNARNPQYNHSAFYNGFGGVRGGIIDKCSGEGFRQGISYVATQHDSDKVDQTAFNVVRNSSFPRSRWGRRFEAVPGQSGWTFDVPGLYCILFSNCTYEASILAPLVYQLPRTTPGPVANIAMLVEENQPVDVGLNDFSPSFVDDPLYPPIPVLPATLTRSRQLVQQALAVLGTLGTVLVAGGDLGPLEPLPADATIDPANGMLSYSGIDPVELVYVEGGKEIPLDRTPVAGTATTTPGATTGYTDAQIDAFLAAKASRQDVADVIGAAPGALDTLAEIAAQLLADEQGAAAILATLQQHTQQIAGKADEDGRFDLLTPYDRAVPESALGGLVNWNYDEVPYTGGGSWIMKPGRTAMWTGGGLIQFASDVQEGDVFALYINPPSKGTRIALSCPGGIDSRGVTTKRFTKGTTVIFRYKLLPAYDDGHGYTRPAGYGVETIQQSTKDAVTYRGEYDPANLSQYYLPGDLVMYQGNILLRSVEGSEPAFDATKWVGGGGQGSSGLPLTATRTADYTLALTDSDKLVPVAAASAVTVTVPDQATVPFPIGTTLYVARDGAGQVSIAAAPGVVVQTGAGYRVPGQWQDVALHKRDLNTWVLKGGVL